MSIRLDVQGLSIDFHLRTHILHAVRDVSFQLHSGRTLCLVGESGSGKSVTARALLRIIDNQARVSNGKITLYGNGTSNTEDIIVSDLDEDEKAIRSIRGGRIGLIFQEPMSSLSPVHTIGAQISESLCLHRKLDRKAAWLESIELLHQVEIADPQTMVNRYTFEFSGGMRQRAMIAMALACDPEILIADEPTTALDVTTQADILDLIKRLQVSRGMAMLLITHDLGLVAEVGDDVAVMRYGRIVESGSVIEVFDQAAHPYTQVLLDATRKLELTKRGVDDSRLVDHNADTSAETSPILSVQNLSMTFGTRNWLGHQTFELQAVNDVSFDLYAGENLGIVGESGSGKTTLGRLLLRIHEPTSGQIVYRPTDSQNTELQHVMAMNRKQLLAYRQQVRMVFQDPFASLNPRMTIRQIVADPLYVAGTLNSTELDQRVVDILEKVGLDQSSLERYPHAFSGGQRQRIGIARALALQPRIVIADEATSALDVSIRSQILDLLLTLQAQLGFSFVFISHDISVVRYFCDRVLVMRRGKLVESGTAEQICDSPQEPYTRSLISAVPSLDPRNKRLLNRTLYNQENTPP